MTHLDLQWHQRSPSSAVARTLWTGPCALTGKSTRLARSADIPVRSNGLCGERATNRPTPAFGRCCGQECPRSAKEVSGRERSAVRCLANRGRRYSSGSGVRAWRRGKPTGGCLRCRGFRPLARFAIPQLRPVPGDIAPKDIHEILLQISLGLSVPDPNGPGFDAVGTQLPGQPKVGDFFALPHLGPGTVCERRNRPFAAKSRALCARP